jgi:23S rRNA pseudouridine1911/1915/1917 synthase
MADVMERLRARFPEASGRSLRQWLRTGRVRVNGAVVRDGRHAAASTDTVSLGPPVSSVDFPRGLGRVYEDDAIIVVDKPPGLLTMATDREAHRTAYRMLWDYLAARRPPQRPFIVHRLDRETSGLLVFAKSPGAKRRLQAQFEARTVERVYVALVRGRVRDDAGTLRGALAEDEARRVRAVDHATGGRSRRGGVPRGSVKEAITHYGVLERRGDLTLLEIVLGTGRRRQIRVQLDALGHPIVGDAERGGHRDRRPRLLLHATRLGFVHPISGARVRFESPPPHVLRPRRTNTRTRPRQANG